MNPYGASRFQGHDTMSYPTQDPYESQQSQQQQQQYHHQGGSSSGSSGSVSSSVSSSGTKRARVDPTFNSDLYQDHHQLDYRSPHYSYESSTTSFASGKRQGGLADGREMMGVRGGGGGAFFDTGYGSGGTVTGISSVSSARTPETAAAMIRGGGRGGSSGGLGFLSLDEGGLTGAAYPTVFGSYGGATHGVGGGGQIREFSARGTVDIGASAYLGGSGQEGEGGSRDDMTMDGDGLEEIRGGIVGGAAALYRSAGGSVDGGVGRYGRGAAGSGATSFASNVFASGGSRRGTATSATLFGGKDGDADDRYSGGTTSIDVSAGGLGGLGYPDVRSGMVGGGFRNIIGNKYSRSGGGRSGGAPDRSGVGRGETGGGCTLRYDHYDGRGSYPPGSGGGAGDGDTACQGLGARSRSVVRGSAAYGVLIGPGSDSGPPVTSNSGANRNLNRIQVCDVPGDGLYGSGVGSGPHVLAPGSTGAAAVAVAVGDEDVEDEEEDSDGSDDHEPLAGWTEVDGWTFSELPLKGEKVGKPSSRDLSVPIHVFEGRRKPGKTGWPSGITWMVSETYKGSLEGIEWPDSLVGIVLTGFNRPVNKVSWPEGLQELHLRGPFDQAIQDARFPESLKALSFGARFNHPVEDASFPEGLEGLFFGDSDKGYERARFNQPLAGIAWPAALKQLSAGQAFQQSLEGADWPDTLEVINIMGSKKQPVEDIEWPPGLKQIHLNGRCRKEAPKAAWPRGCKVFAWSPSRKAAIAQPPKFGTTKVGLSNFSGHNMEQIMFEY